jgi:hypothetical protein
VAIAVVGASCGGAQSESATAPAPKPAPSSSVTVRDDEEGTSVAAPPTEGSGPCRCSWDPKPMGVARVCRVGEHSHTGALCVRGDRPKYPTGLKIGPLDPPDLRA